MNMFTQIVERPQRRAPRCSACGDEGHNIRTCPSDDARMVRSGQEITEERRTAMNRARFERETALVLEEQRVRIEQQQRAREAREERDRLRIEREERDEEPIIRGGRFRHREMQQIQRARQQEQAQAHRQRTPQNREIIEQLMREAEADHRIMLHIALQRRLPQPEPAQPRPEDTITIAMKRIAELPIIRDTAVETKDCPVCMDTLGETGKTVLKCGHSLCQTCFLQQVFRSVALKKATECACPMCRVNYIE